MWQVGSEPGLSLPLSLRPEGHQVQEVFGPRDMRKARQPLDAMPLLRVHSALAGGAPMSVCAGPRRSAWDRGCLPIMLHDLRDA